MNKKQSSIENKFTVNIYSAHQKFMCQHSDTVRILSLQERSLDYITTAVTPHDVSMRKPLCSVNKVVTLQN